MTSFVSILFATLIVAHEPGYSTSLANHVRRWLRSEQVAAKVVTPQELPAALAGEKIAFLVGYNQPTAEELKPLRAFRARGGRLVVFHSRSQALGELMGVRPLGYAAAPSAGSYARMDFAEARSPGVPASIRQSSGGLERAVPVPGRARVLATWTDRAGRSTGEPAWIVSSAGWWMTHVLLAEGDEELKAQLCAALVGAVNPSAWSYASHRRRVEAARQATRALALRQVPRKGEIHAVWEHTGQGLYPGDWPRTFRLLRESHVTDLFVNVAGAGFAHYPSSFLPRSKTFREEGDQLAACLAAARGTGVRVHAWILCFNATRGDADKLRAFERKGWCLKNKAGGMTTYLNPALAAVRQHSLATVDELQTRYPALAGIHLDFVRWYEGAARPADAASVVTAFVAEARRHVARPRWLTTSVLGKYPQCVASVGQDWPRWLAAGLVDYVVPMDYSEDRAKFESYLAQHAALKGHAARTIVGIGVTANESRLTAADVMDQINLSRKYGCAGQSLFDLDTTLETQVLPYLRLRQW